MLMFDHVTHDHDLMEVGLNKKVFEIMRFVMENIRNRSSRINKLLETVN